MYGILNLWQQEQQLMKTLVSIGINSLDRTFSQ